MTRPELHRQSLAPPSRRQYLALALGSVVTLGIGAFYWVALTALAWRWWSE